MKLKLAILSVLLSSSAFAEPPSVGLITHYGLNTATIYRTVYDGMCPGVSESFAEAFFVSESTPTAPNRRVLVKNTTLGMKNDPYPYTDREYTAGRSEHTFLALASKHHTQTFSVLAGENTFEYLISENGASVEEGKFQMQIQVEEKHVVRNQVCTWQPRCNSYTCHNVWVCYCP